MLNLNNPPAQPKSDRLTEIDSGFSAATSLDVIRKNSAGTALEYAASSGGLTNEDVDDRVNDLLIVESQLTKTYNDPANTLTLGVTNKKLLDDVYTDQASLPSTPTSRLIYFERSTAGGTYVGDTTAGSGQLTYGFYWWYDGTRWRSPRLEWRPWGSNVTPTNEPDKRPYFALPPSGLFNLFVCRFKAKVYVLSVNNSLNYWNFALAVGSTTLASFNSSAGSPDVYIDFQSTINSQINITSSGPHTIYVYLTNVGAPGALYWSGEMTYNWVRI